MRGKSARTVRGPAGAEFRSRPHGRVPQGSPKGRRTWGRLFFGYFLLAKQKKVTCCRAAPGEVVFDLRHKANPPQSPFSKGEVRNPHPNLPLAAPGVSNASTYGGTRGNGLVRLRRPQRVDHRQS